LAFDAVFLSNGESMKTYLLLCLNLLVLALFASSAIAASSPALPPSTRNVNQVAISPDGTHVAWVEALADEAGEPTGDSAIYVLRLDSSGTKPTRVFALRDHDADDGSISWSPNSKHLAFLSDAESSRQSQLYVSDLAGTSKQLTTVTGFLADPSWSPDGQSLAFLFTENAPRAAGPLMAMTPETGVIDSRIYEQRLAVVDAAGGKIRQLSPADMYVYEYDWAPDGKSFAAIAAHGAGDAQWYVAQLYTVPTSGGEMKSIYKPALQIAGPRWSPDGRNIAFITGLMSDEGSTGGDIFVVPAAGGEPRNITPRIEASPSTVKWDSPTKILFTENVDGESGVATVDIASGKIASVWHGPETIATAVWGGIGISLASDHLTSAVIRDSSSSPPEVWVGPLANWKQVTHINQAVHPQWGEIKSMHWKSDGNRVQGWLVCPVNYDAKKRYPMVVVVHGGPASGVTSEWPGAFFNTSLLSAAGYFVLYPSPRGSYGQGEAFTRAKVKDFGYGDFRDILAGVNAVEKQVPVDDNRVGITGWSYGGFMTMWAVTQTNRFQAAVSGAGLSNWQSYYGENDIDEWMIPYFGASVYRDPKIYAKSSPINFITRAKTPTLVLVGDRDGEVPAPQSREFWHALKTLGVDTQMVIYKDEGHAILQPDHRRDIMERMTAWFNKYLK
jgi:dipeptidyl aminopeptidase/acylaminoacyl peptidase